MNATRIIITRHGETDWNSQKRIQGHTDLALNLSGKEQAEALSKRLSSSSISTIFTSDLKRALETATILKARLNGAEVVVTPLLRERNWGEFEGKCWNEIVDRIPDEIKKMQSHPLNFTPEGGESRSDMLERVKSFLSSIENINASGMIAVVTHGGVASLMIKYLTGMNLDSITPFHIENCSVNILENKHGKRWVINCLNDTSHLPGLRVL